MVAVLCRTAGSSSGLQCTALGALSAEAKQAAACTAVGSLPGWSLTVVPVAAAVAAVVLGGVSLLRGLCRHQLAAPATVAAVATIAGRVVPDLYSMCRQQGGRASVSHQATLWRSLTLVRHSLSTLMFPLLQKAKV